MSIKRMSAVWDHSQHKGSELLLMLAIADTANDLGVAWPGYPYLANKIRMARRSAIRLASTCAESGELWILNRDLQRSNIYIVTVGLTTDELQLAAEQALKMGAATPTGSDILSPPPQVLVVTSCHHVVTDQRRVVIPPSPDSDAAMSPDPSLSVTNHQGEEKLDGLTSLWFPVLDRLSIALDRGTFDTWLKDSRLVGATNGTWTVELQHPAAVAWVANRLYPSRSFQGAIEDLAPQVEHIEFIAKEKTA